MNLRAMPRLATSGPSGALPPGAMPADIRWMNGVALVVAVLALGVLAAAAAAWVVRAPWWTLRAVDLHGDLARNSAATVRANTLPRLRGNFLTLDLAETRAVFETVPWVRRAVVRRVWPNRLSVTFEEHRPAARWAAADGNERLVNTFGEVFEGTLSTEETDALPLLSGPDGSASKVLAMWRAFNQRFAPLGRTVAELDLSGRGSWTVTLDDEADIEVGRGTDAEVLARTERFIGTVTQVTAYYKAPLEHADLRHSGAYAVRLKGVTTIDGPGADRAGARRN